MGSPSLYLGRPALFDLLSVNKSVLLRNGGMDISAYDPMVNLSAGVIHLISIALLFWLFKFHQLTTSQRVVWLILVVALSLPAVISFLLMNPFKGVYSTSENKKLNVRSNEQNQLAAKSL